MRIIITGETGFRANFCGIGTGDRQVYHTGATVIGPKMKSSFTAARPGGGGVRLLRRSSCAKGTRMVASRSVSRRRAPYS